MRLYAVMGKVPYKRSEQPNLNLNIQRFRNRADTIIALRNKQMVQFKYFVEKFALHKNIFNSINNVWVFY